MVKLEARIQQLAAADEQDNRLEQELAQQRTKLAKAETERDEVSSNLARKGQKPGTSVVQSVFL
jgi:hypothetical protein